MFTFILFLSVIVIFIWARNRFNALEQHLEGLERKLKEVRTAPKPAQEAIPVKPAPPMPSPAEAQPAAKPSAVPWPPPKIEAPPVLVADDSPREASPPPGYLIARLRRQRLPSLPLLLRRCRHGKCRSSTGKISLA